MSKKLVCLDIETTGLNILEDEILQISVIDENEKVLLNTYIKPKTHTTWKDAERVNGISPEMVQDSPSFDQIRPMLQRIIDQADVVLGYNHIYFDIPFLKNLGVQINDDKELVDVMLDFAEIYGEWNEHYGNYKWQKLTTCACYYNYQFHAHDSLEDVKATLYCYKKMNNL